MTPAWMNTFWFVPHCKLMKPRNGQTGIHTPIALWMCLLLLTHSIRATKNLSILPEGLTDSIDVLEINRKPLPLNKRRQFWRGKKHSLLIKNFQIKQMFQEKVSMLLKMGFMYPQPF